MAVSVNETETKYDVPGGIALPRLDDLPRVAATSEPAAERLVAEYYDTADLRLIRAGITLRRRKGGSDAGWHLKLPVGPDTRREIRLPLGRAGRAVPSELARLVRAYTRREPLRLVVEMTTTRRRQVLLDQAGESLAEVAADDVTAHTLGDSTTLSSWQEVEVELTGGDRALLSAADELLRSNGLRRSGRSAKLERALGLEPDGPVGSGLEGSKPAGSKPEGSKPAGSKPAGSKPAGSGPAGSGPPGPDTPALEVVRAYLAAQAGVLKSLDPMVRGDEPDSVHQMRVTTRRLRSTLRTFGNVISRPGTDRLSAELQWLGAVLGEARDAEVLAGHLLASLSDLPAEQVIGPIQARVQGHFGPAGAAARVAVQAALDSDRYLDLLDELDRVIAEPAAGPDATLPAGEALTAAIRRAYRQARRRMRRAHRSPAGPARDAALHAARKAAKRARYAGEAVAPALGRPADRFAGQMKKVQSVLGEHQDSVIARQAERQLGMSAHLAGENAFSYGLLFERDAQRASRLRAKARRIWKQASRSRYRQWMR